MSEITKEVLETKLDILIEDFQRFRTQDREKIKELYTETHLCREEIASMRETLRWHKIIATSIIGFATMVFGYFFTKGN